MVASSVFLVENRFSEQNDRLKTAKMEYKMPVWLSSVKNGRRSPTITYLTISKTGLTNPCNYCICQISTKNTRSWMLPKIMCLLFV